MAITILTLDIILSPKDKLLTYLNLFKIIFAGTILRLTPLFMIPGLYGDDPLTHQSFTTTLIDIHHVPQNMTYSDFPIMHLQIAIHSIVSGMDFKLSSVSSVTLLQITLWSIFVYLIVKELSGNYKAALLSALLFSFSDVPLGYSLLGAFPTTFAILFLFPIVFLLVKENRLKIYRNISLFFMLILILTHSLTPFFFLIILLFLFYGSRLLKCRVRIDNYLIPFYMTLMFCYWIYVSDLIFTRFIKVIFQERGVYASFTTIGGTSYAQTIPVSEYFLSTFGQGILYSFSVIGFLYCISKLYEYREIMILTTIGLTALFVGVISQILSIGTAPDRLIYYSYMFIPISSAYGVLYSVKKYYSIPYVRITFILVILLLPFFMITSPFSNYDSPIYSQDVISQKYLKASEIQCLEDISGFYNGTIGADDITSSYVKRIENGKAIPINFYSGNFSAFEGIVILREHFTEKPIYSLGLYQIAYDPYAKLSNQGFNEIYDSKVVSVFYK